MILSADTGVGTLPFAVTPELAAANLPEEALVECLCRPEHGTNFNDSPGGMMKTQKRYCLWSLPTLLYSLGIGSSSGTDENNWFSTEIRLKNLHLLNCSSIFVYIEQFINK